MKKQQQNWHTFDFTTLEAKGGPCNGEYYGLPWPCWGNAEMGHPGTPNLYDTSKRVADGELCFRARFGTERNGESLLAEGSYPLGSEIEGGYPEFSADLLKKLAELQQEMFAEINIADANDAGIRDGQAMWVEGPEGGRIEVKAKVTEHSVARGVVWMPFHFGGKFQGKDLREKYPKGSDPYVLGEACNTVFTYGYDSVIQMQETKASLCRIRPA